MSQNYYNPYGTNNVVYVQPVESANVTYPYPSTIQNTIPNSMSGVVNQPASIEPVIPSAQQVNVTVGALPIENKNKGLSKLDPARGFVKKVYALVTLQFCISGLITGLFLLQDVQNWVSQHEYITYIAYVVAFCLLCVITCSQKAANKYPLNVILLFSFTFCFSIVLAVIVACYNVESIVMGLIVTAVVVLFLTLIAWFAPFDFTACGGLLCAVLFCAACFGLLNIFFRNRVFYTLYACIGALIFSLYIVYDTQMLMINKKNITYGPDDYIHGALNLYLDIVYLFLYLIRIINDMQHYSRN